MKAFIENLLRRPSLGSGQIETFFLSYDEPFKEERWLRLKSQIPSAKRVDGVKGFDRAHKFCVAQAIGPRILIVDGDNELLPNFFQERIPRRLYDSPYVLSWSAVNSINGLKYGNGGVKSWDTSVLAQLKSHENAERESSAVDFCFDTKYYQMPSSLSISKVNETPFQAFRAGFREGVKLGLNRGIPLDDFAAKRFSQNIAESNLYRLKVWCSVGADVSNGLWGIYGSRLGLLKLYRHEIQLETVRDYYWFEHFWEQEIKPHLVQGSQVCPLTHLSWSSSQITEWTENLGPLLSETLGLSMKLFSSDDSEAFKKNMKNPHREGLMFRETSSHV